MAEVEQVRTKDLTLFRKAYLPQIFGGLMLTFKQMFKPKVTRQYPEEKWAPPTSFRGRPVLVKAENGIERCVACGLCSRVCPALAIEVQANETPTLERKDILKNSRSICFAAYFADSARKFAPKKQLL